ncbi:MAG TPA: FAD-dependent monooxygenase [Micromonosporaceae bacterium]|nr:FAD-dependent monooxygenase [Micromonosporaceae bacterium]
MAVAPFHVMIIGAGTGGMCLAHGLKQAGISVAVYERDRTRTDGLYGYRVGIDPDGSRSLHACLPQDLYDTFVATCARAPRYFNMLDEQMRELLSLRLRDETDPINSEKSVSRMTLRQVLLTDADDMVHFDKDFVRYEHEADGRVTAHFADGTSATGDLLVAADGTRSRVRRQYLPHATVQPSGVIAVGGKVALTDETKRLVSPKVFEGISLVFAPRGYSVVLHVMEFKWDRSGKVRNDIGGNDAELIARWPGLMYDNTRDYINWGFAAHTDKFPDDVTEMRGTDLVRLVEQMTLGWEDNLRTIFHLTDPGSCFPVSIATSVPVPQWKTTNVTLLGDAIHTMTAGRGVGANTALRDANLLRRKLIAVRDGQKKLLEAVHEYETKMVEYGFQAVEDSKKQQNGDSILHKPVVGRVALAAMRTGMRVVNRLPSVQKKMTDSLYRYRGADRDEEE